MPGHRVRSDISLVDPSRISSTTGELLDEVDEFGIQYLLEGGAGSRVLPDPEHAGQMVTLNLNKDGGTITVTTATTGTMYSGAGVTATASAITGTTLSFIGNGSFAVLLAIQVADALAWGVVGGHNVTLT